MAATPKPLANDTRHSDAKLRTDLLEMRNGKHHQTSQGVQ